jgi:hypothetical protein
LREINAFHGVALRLQQFHPISLVQQDHFLQPPFYRPLTFSDVTDHKESGRSTLQKVKKTDWHFSSSFRAQKDGSDTFSLWLKHFCEKCPALNFHLLWRKWPTRKVLKPQTKSA